MTDKFFFSKSKEPIDSKNTQWKRIEWSLKTTVPKISNSFSPLSSLVAPLPGHKLKNRLHSIHISTKLKNFVSNVTFGILTYLKDHSASFISRVNTYGTFSNVYIQITVLQIFRVKFSLFLWILYRGDQCGQFSRIHANRRINLHRKYI